MSPFSFCNWWGESCGWWRQGRGLPSAGVEIKGPGSSGNEPAVNRRTARRIRRKEVWVVMIAVARTVCDRKMDRNVSEVHIQIQIYTHILTVE